MRLEQGQKWVGGWVKRAGRGRRELGGKREREEGGRGVLKVVESGKTGKEVSAEIFNYV